MEHNSNNTEHHVVTVWDLDVHPLYELFFRFAQGFIHAAIAVLEEQRDSAQRDYFNIMPAHFALEHGIELFLKGAILLGDNSITPVILSSKEFGHNLEELYNRYCQIYTDDRFRMYHRVDELIDWRATINDPRGFAARYPFDNKGIRYGSRNRMIDVEFELGILREFLNDLKRLEQEIKRTLEVQSCPIEQFPFRSKR